MIENINTSGKDYKVDEALNKYVEKRLGKLDRYLPRGSKKDVILKVVVAKENKSKNDRYELTATLEIPGGKVITAKDECSNIFAGVDLVEAKLAGQIRRFKLEAQPHRQKRSLKNLFIRRK